MAESGSATSAGRATKEKANRQATTTRDPDMTTTLDANDHLILNREFERWFHSCGILKPSARPKHGGHGALPFGDTERYPAAADSAVS
jgi:hypothetical protein